MAARLYRLFIFILISLSLLGFPAFVHAELPKSAPASASASPQAIKTPRQLELLKASLEEMKFNFGNPKFQGPTFARMLVGGAATAFGFHQDGFSLKAAWIPIVLSAVQVGALSHLMPILKRWYNSSNPFLLANKRPGEARAFANFLVKGTLLFMAYNYLNGGINHLVAYKPQSLAVLLTTAFVMILSQSAWSQSFLRDADLPPTASTAEKMESLQRLNLRIVILASVTIALNKLAVLQVAHIGKLQAAVIVAGVLHYLFAPKIRQRLHVKSLASAAIQRLTHGLHGCRHSLQRLIQN